MMPVNTRAASANRVTWVGFWVNLLLTVSKLAAGIAGHSGAMVADAVHSLSDLATDLVVLASFRVAGKPADRSHDYGHGKYETLATAVVGPALLAAGVGILRTRRIGSDIAIDLHVRMPPDTPLADAHAIASKIESDLRNRFRRSTYVSIHMEPNIDIA